MAALSLHVRGSYQSLEDDDHDVDDASDHDEEDDNNGFTSDCDDLILA